MFRKVAALAAVTALLVLGVSACAPTPEVVEKVVKETVVVEKEVEVTKVVEKEVEVTKEVPVEVTKIVEKVVTATPEPVEEKDTLVIGTSVDPTNLDPAFMYSMSADFINTAVFDRIGWRSEPDMSPVLWAAESLERLDPLTWQVKLREGIKFHNGKPLTAESVKVTIERYGTLEGTNRWYYNQANIDHVDVVDEYTANIVTKEPFELMEYVAANSFYLVEPEYYSSTPVEELAVHPIGTGPYKFVEYTPDDRVVLERNEEYWGEKPDFKRVIFRIIPEAAVRLAELEAGNIDLIEKVPVDKADTLERMPNVHPASIASGRRVFLQVTQEPGTPLADTRVRQALQYAIDVDTIIETLLGGMTSRMATYPNPPNAHPDLKPYPYDPEKARELLAEAGYPDGFEVSLWTTSGRLTKDVEIAQAIATYLADVGIEAEVKPLEYSVYRDKYFACGFDGLWQRSEGPEYNDQGDLQGISVEHSKGAECAKWDNPEWRSLYAELRGESDWDRRRELSLKLQEIAYEDPPIVMLYNEPNLYGVSDLIEWQPRVDERLYPARMWRASK